MACHGARRLLPMTQNLFWIIGVEAMMAAQGVEFRAPHVTSPRLLAATAAIRARIAPLVEDRYMADDMAAAGELVASDALAMAAGEDILPGLLP
jgi:histidine ammonia-lyase